MNFRELKTKYRRLMKLQSETFRKILKENPNATDFSKAFEYGDEAHKLLQEYITRRYGYIPAPPCEEILREVNGWLVLYSYEKGYKSMMGYMPSSGELYAVNRKIILKLLIEPRSPNRKIFYAFLEYAYPEMSDKELKLLYAKLTSRIWFKKNISSTGFEKFWERQKQKINLENIPLQITRY